MNWWGKYIGLPFQEKGRDLSGLDCWGLLRLVYLHEKQIELPGYEQYYQTTDDRRAVSQTIEEQSKWRWHEVVNPAPFDAVLLSMQGVPMHVGLVTKRGSMLHCVQGIGVVHERYDQMRWKSKVRGFFRYE